MKVRFNNVVNGIDSIHITLLPMILPLFFFIEDKNIVLAIVVGLITVYRSIFIAINIAEKKINKLAITTSVLSIITVVISIILLKSPYYVELRLSLLGLQSIIFRILFGVDIKYNLSYIYKLLNDYIIVFPIFLNRIFGIITSYLLPIFVIYFVDLETYGKYQYLIKISSVLIVFQSSLNHIIEPYLIKLYKKVNLFSEKIVYYILKSSFLVFFVGFLFYLIIFNLHSLINLDFSIFKHNFIYLIFSSTALFIAENIWRIHKFLGKVSYLAFMNIYAFFSSLICIYIIYLSNFILINHFAFSVLIANTCLLLITFYKKKRYEVT